MDKVLKIYELVNNIETPFPNSTLQAELYSFQYDCKRMGNAPTITGTIMYPLCLDEEWSNNVFIGFKGERYYIDSIPSSSYSNEDVRYKHDLTFVSERKVLEDEYFCEIVEVNGEKSAVKTEFSFFGDIYMLVDKLNDYLQWSGMDYRITIDSGITTEEKEIVISNMKINDVLKYGFELFDIPYYFVGKVCTYGLFENEIEDVFEYGVNNSLLSIRKENRNEPIVTKITGVGSSENIPYYYPNFNESGEHDVTTDPTGYTDDISKLNYLKIDPYTNLRNGGYAKYYKACVNPIGNDFDEVSIQVLSETNAPIIDKYNHKWKSGFLTPSYPDYILTNTQDIVVTITPHIFNQNIELNSIVHAIAKSSQVGEEDYVSDNVNSKIISIVGLRGYQQVGVTYTHTDGVISLNSGVLTKIIIRLKCTFEKQVRVRYDDWYIEYYYDTQYSTLSSNTTVKSTDGTIDEKVYSNFNKVIDYPNGIRTYRNTFTYKVTRKVAGYSTASLNSVFRGVFLDNNGDDMSEWNHFIPNPIVVKDGTGTTINHYLSQGNYIYFRNTSDTRQTFTIEMSVIVQMSTESTDIKAYGVELEYKPDFKRKENPYDYWKFHDGKEVKYSVVGIKFNDTSAIPDGLKVKFSATKNWIEPKPYLMPSVYRKSYGKDIWYKALNDTHKDANGNYITFENLFNSQRPKTLIADPKNDIKPTIVGIVNSGATNIYWNQLIKPINSDNYTIKYATIKEADGSIIISATSVVNEAMFIPNDTFLIKGHKYYIEINTSYKGVEKIIPHRLSVGGFILATTNRNFIYICKNNQEGIILHCYSDSETDVLLNKFIITDLTLMFGEGNEPTNIQEFYDRLPSTINLNSFNILLDNYSEPILVGSENNTGNRIDQFLDIAFDNNDNNVDWKPLEGSSESSDNSTRGTEELIHSFFFAKLKKTDGDMGFNLFDQSIENGEMTITMTSGLCGSCDFKIMVNDDGQNTVQVDENGDLVRDEDGNVKFGTPQDIQQDTSKAEVWIALLKEQDSYGVIKPDKQNNIIPTTDDTFVITNILMPEQYFINAENKLEQELLKEMSDKNTDKFNFSIDFSRIYLAENPSVHQQLNENSKIYVKYNQRILPLYISSYLFKCNKNESLPDVKVELIDKLNLKTNDIQKEINKIKKQIISAK